MAEPLLAQLKRHKTELLVGAAGLAGAVAIYLKQKNKSGGTTAVAVSTPATVVTPGYNAFPGTTVATTAGTDAYNGMENQILGLQQSLLGLSSQNASKTTSSSSTGSSSGTTPAAAYKSHIPTTPPTAQGFAGEGYYVESSSGGRSAGNVAGMTGSIFSTISSYTATLAELSAGDTVYYESSLGGFTPITSVAQFKGIEPTGKGGKNDTTTYAKAA